jgi:condensin complex subunit 3
MTNENISRILQECQKSFAYHKKANKALYKLQSSDPKQFIKDFLPFLNRILLVFNREPAVERLVQFIIHFACNGEHGQDGEEFSMYLVRYLLRHTAAQDKAVRFRSCQIIAGIINTMNEDTEIE